MQKPIPIKVGAGGVNPTIGATDYNNPAFAGVEGYYTRSGFGIMDYTDYQILSTGGMRLLNWQFAADELYFFVPTGVTYSTPGGDYTNGFNLSAVMVAMFGRIGWRNSTITDKTMLGNVSSTMSKSGRYFNDAHSLVSLTNLFACQEDPDISVNDFNAYLDAKQRASIMRALNGVLNGREMFEQVLLFDRYGLNDTPITNSGRFCYFEIVLAKDFNIAIQIEALTLLFDSNVTFPLYLFKDGKASPVWSMQVTAVANEATVVNISDLILNYIGAGTKGHRFFFGYFQDDLGAARAIWEQPEMFNKTRCFRAQGAETNRIGNTINFNRNQPSYTYKNYGLNIQFSSFKDWTNSIISRANLFDELILLMMAYSVLETIVYSVRSNGSERILRENVDKYNVMFEMNGAAPISNSPYMTGLNKRIERELMRVKKGFYPQPKASTLNFIDDTPTFYPGRY